MSLQDTIWNIEDTSVWYCNNNKNEFIVSAFTSIKSIKHIAREGFCPVCGSGLVEMVLCPYCTTHTNTAIKKVCSGLALVELHGYLPYAGWLLSPNINTIEIHIKKGGSKNIYTNWNTRIVLTTIDIVNREIFIGDEYLASLRINTLLNCNIVFEDTHE